jgi:hypothetical protein
MWIEMDGEEVGQIDVFAALLTPFHESRLLVECKGGQPTFDEIKTFGSLRVVMSPPPDESIIVCKNNTKENRKQLAATLGVRVLERQQWANYILPLLGGASVRPERIVCLNKWLAALGVWRKLVSLTGSHDDLKSYYRELATVLWWISDPTEQIRRSHDCFEQHRATAGKVASHKGTTTAAELTNPQDELVQSAHMVSLLHRFLNLYGVTRCALAAQQGGVSSLEGVGRNLRRAMNDITSNPRTLFGFPGFFQYWMLLWGGAVRKREWSREISAMAADCECREEAVNRYMEVIRTTYSSDTTSLLYENDDIMFFKYVPAPFRALGVLQRQEKGLMPTGAQLFREDAQNIACLGQFLSIDLLAWETENA